MKQLRLFACAGVLALMAACHASTETSDESNDATSDAIEASEVPASALAEVKKETGRDGVSARPIFEPGTLEPAYFEVALEPGWAVVTAPGATNADPHVVEWSDRGRSPTERLDLGARAAMKRVYRLDAAVYVAVDPSGKAVGRSTKSLVRIDRSGDEPKLVEVTSDEALATWRAERTNLRNAELDDAKNGGLRTQDTPLIGSTPPDKTCAVKGEVPSYSQLSPGEGPNTTRCASGCGPTAWATVFGWASRRATEDGAFAGLFASEAPLTMTPEIGQLSMDLNHIVHTMCVGDQGATTPWSMAEVKSWVAARAPEVTVEQRYNFLMTPDPAIRDLTVDALCDGRPVIIGIGSLFGGDGHYPIAKGYSNGKFELEMGWGSDGNGWYDATTWYMGTIRH